MQIYNHICTINNEEVIGILYNLDAISSTRMSKIKGTSNDNEYGNKKDNELHKKI